MVYNLKKIGQYRLVKFLGKGSFAEVYEARKDGSSERLAIKMIKREPGQKQVNRATVQHEIQVIKGLNHENIIRLYDAIETTNNHYLVFQLCQLGDLQTYLKNRTQILPQRTIQHILYCVGNAIRVLHSKGIVHRDLKMANILLKKDKTIKLADFGMAKDTTGLHDQLMKTYCGTPLTMAPQILAQKGYDNKCDIWSLGIIAFQLIYRKNPFQFKNLIHYLQLVTQTDVVIPNDPIKSSTLVDLIKGTIQRDPSKRISIDQFLNNQWILQGAQAAWQQIPEPQLSSPIRLITNNNNNNPLHSQAQIIDLPLNSFVWIASRIRKYLHEQIRKILNQILERHEKFMELCQQSTQISRLYGSAHGQFLKWLNQSKVSIILKIKQAKQIKFNLAQIKCLNFQQFKPLNDFMPLVYSIGNGCMSYLQTAALQQLPLDQRKQRYQLVIAIMNLLRKFQFQVVLKTDLNTELDTSELFNALLTDDLPEFPPSHQQNICMHFQFKDSQQKLSESREAIIRACKKRLQAIQREIAYQ